MNEIYGYIIYYGTMLLQVVLVILVIKFIFSSLFKNYHSNWYTLIDDFNFSSQEFYELLKVELEATGMKRVRIKKVALKEGNAFSSKRTYLRASWKEYQYDICAAPFAKGFFISWWLLYKNSLGQLLVSKIPFVGGWLARKLFPVTYYKIDTASMFMSYAHAAVLKVVDNITNKQGIRSLSETERKPILNDVFRR